MEREKREGEEGRREGRESGKGEGELDTTYVCQK